MTGNVCADFFERSDLDGEFVKKLPSTADALLFEKLTAAPEFSRGPVGDDEKVFRKVFEPIHVKNGEPDPTCFGDAWNKGLSVDRVADIKDEDAFVKSAHDEVRNFNETKAENQLERGLWAVVELDVGAIRRIFFRKNERAFAVFDTGLKANSAHADVAGLGSPSPKEKRNLRTSLWALFENGRQLK